MISLHSPSSEDVSQLRPATPSYAHSRQDPVLDPNAIPPGSSARSWLYLTLEYITIRSPPEAMRRSGSTSRRSSFSGKLVM
jgi:hypothetical protein